MLSNFNNRVEKTVQQEERQYIVFVIGKEQFGVDVKQAREIITTTNFTAIPDASESVRGVINLRGEIIPIIDLRKKLNFSNENPIEETKVIIVELDNALIGMQVDDVKEMMRLSVDDIADPPKAIQGIRRDYINGVGKLKDRLLILLDLKKILSAQEIKELDNMDIN